MAPEQTPEPGEQIYLPGPSWAPFFFAVGVTGLVCGIFAEGFMLRGWAYCIAGGIFLLAALASLVNGTIRGFFQLPRHQRVRGAVLPAGSLRSSAKRRS
jgi:hypothetical protein